MNIMSEDFLNGICDEFGITEEELRKSFPNDEDILIPIAKMLLEKRKIKFNNEITLEEFIGNYNDYGNTSAELHAIVTAIEMSQEIKNLHDEVETQRNNAFKKTIKAAIASGEISSELFKTFEIETITMLFFEIVDVRTANANVMSVKDNEAFLADTKKMLDIYYGFLSNWDKIKDNAVKLIKFGMDYNLTSIKELLDDKSRILAKNLGDLDYADVLRKPTVFVIMQFSPKYTALYKEVIIPICKKHGYNCFRADDIYQTGIVLNSITDSVSNSDIIIAEISSKNPNVYFEVGYASAMKKPIIFLCVKKNGDLPFDIASSRILFYENTIAGKTAIETTLSKYLENIKKGNTER